MSKVKRRRHGEEDDAASGPPKVVVVNDDDDACELLCRILEREGYIADRAETQEQALAQVGFLRPQCVILDLATGGIGQNLKLLDMIRSNPDSGVAVTRCLLVAQGTSNQMFSWQAGIDAFLVRPFHADELLRLLDEVIARPEAERPRHRRQQADEAGASGRQSASAGWSAHDA
jgi:two-component system alkaline phosphatase synthesis response regulator PhoP